MEDELAVLVPLDADHDRVPVGHAQVHLLAVLDLEEDQHSPLVEVHGTDVDTSSGGQRHAPHLFEIESQPAAGDHAQTFVAKILAEPVEEIGLLDGAGISREMADLDAKHHLRHILSNGDRARR